MTATGAGFRRLARELSARADGVRAGGVALGNGWRGGARDAAAGALDRAESRLRGAADAVLACGQVLTELGEQVRTARALLERGYGPLAVEVATRADAAATGRLAALSRALRDPAAFGAPVDPAVPARGTPPTTVRAWWAGLTADQRVWLVANRPGDVGGLDGVPAADRDAANRVRLAAALDAAARRGDEALLRGLGAIAARLADGGRVRAYLLGLDVSGDGRAIVAMGDPDRATDVLTYVPGANTALASLGGLLDRTDRMRDAAERLDGTADVATVLWLGYDAPEWASAMSASAAHAAVPDLDRFLDGLRATHEGPPAHQTVLGHSYGSLVVGATARDAGLNADDVVFVGSAGVGVPSADRLELPAGHVWSSTARSDPFAYAAPGFGQFVRDAAHNVTAPFSRWYADPVPNVDMWHGHNPSDRTFGANVFTSDPRGGHSGYFAGAGLENIARIAVGGQHLANVD
ncbi:alpha/beta hydrolase [Luedemannella helvata]